MSRHRLRIALLSLGVLWGYGSAFAHFHHGHHAHHGYHARHDGARAPEPGHCHGGAAW